MVMWTPQGDCFDMEVYLCLGSADKSIRKWDIFSGKCKSIYEGHEAVIQCVLAHHNYLFSSSYDKTARNWNLRTGECLQVYSGHSRAVSPLLFVNLSVADKRTERRKSRVNIERRLSTVSQKQSQDHKSLLITGKESMPESVVAQGTSL